MPIVRKTPLYMEDLDAILQYLEEHNFQAAEDLAEDLDRVCNLMASQPGLGRPRDELCPGARSVVVGKYVLIFSRTTEGITAVRLFHGSRDIAAAFNSSEPD